MRIEVTDTVGTSGTMIIDHSDFAEAVRPWYPDAPSGVTRAIREVQDSLNGFYDANRHGWAETYLGITVTLAEEG